MEFPLHEGFFSEDFHFYDYLDYYALITSVVMQGEAQELLHGPWASSAFGVHIIIL
jgi:hypothetical protein